ncbi:diguanylate cyclase (GGDEF)-like protein/PAS domain S-box-containing protein [Duganella sp. 3397]|uniref:sensor domain-containing diguanylate cyclase n=1 Tax=Duganella sp. 3397 TaxID=2817732 RepID=UPI002859460A|nr:diguanylate cyclase [Duganella sp. 3397]MDR7047833.1 diguanylate cyclase (GGDEF)-like protein/PAS domain S-box-containing protein [Duganella sp. 3397]
MSSLPAQPRSPAYLRFRRRLLTGLCLTAALAITVVIAQVRTSYVEREQAMRSQTDHYAKAMEAYVLHALQSVDLAMIGFANAIKVLPNAQNGAAVSELLSARAANFNADYWLSFLDTKGNVIATSLDIDIEGHNYAERDYFKAHLDNRYGNRPFIGAPVIGKYTGAKLFFVSRRAENAKGEFIGVLLAPLDVRRYVALFDNSRFTADMSITLLYRDGRVIARSPLFEQSFGRDLSGGELFRQLRNGNSGTYKAVGIVDGLHRIYSYRVFEQLPLIMLVGSSDADAVRQRDRSYLVAGAGLVCLLFLMTAGGIFSLRTHARQEARELRIRALLVESREMEQKLRANEESMKLSALLFHNLGEAMMVTDAGGRILTVNPAFSILSGYTEQQVIGRRSYELTAGREGVEFFAKMAKTIRDTGQWDGEVWHRHQDGTEYLAKIRFDTVHDDFGHPFRYVVLLSDVTEKKASEERIWRQANFDTLTGLPNRRMFHERLRQEMKKSDRARLPMAILFVDLDHFKEVNDTMGHDKGDLLLKQVAERLTASMRGTDVVARLGGDEFIALLGELRNPPDVTRTAKEILKQMRTPFDLDGDGQQIANISSSIGIALYPQDGKDIETLMKNADQAMYGAKENGKNRYQYYASVDNVLDIHKDRCE